MFSNFKISFAVAFVLALGLQVHAHASISPALGVSGTPVRGDVQRPSTAKPCGTASLAAVDSSTAVTAAANGNVALTITNFNAGTDGSRAIKSLEIDTTATGKSFKAAAASAITVNGLADPTSAGSQPITMKLPVGTKCTGGTAKDLCLVSFTTDGGFGNCVVVKQSAAAKRDMRPHGSRMARVRSFVDEVDDILE